MQDYGKTVASAAASSTKAQQAPRLLGNIIRSVLFQSLSDLNKNANGGDDNIAMHWWPLHSGDFL